MAATLTINLAKAIRSAVILGYGPSSGPAPPGAASELNAVNPGSQAVQSPELKLEAEKAVFSQVNQMLKGVVAKLNAFCDEAFAVHKEEIARLSVEIARKILAQKAKDGDYEIESIIKEALNNAPVRQDVVLHLNPEDLCQYQKLQQDEPSEDLAGVKFVPDSNIGRAECMLETPKGIIESLIDQDLEQVGNALKKVK